MKSYFSHTRVTEIPSLSLAFIGDSVLEQFIREALINLYSKNIRSLHKKTVSFVNCKSQAEFAKTIMDLLNDKEKQVLNRAKNAKSTVPKNASAEDYKLATGLEALFGYLYLEQSARLDEMFDELLKFMKARLD